MKKIYTLILLATLHFSSAQQPLLLSTTWYLQNVIIDGVDHIPPNSNMYLAFDSSTSFSTLGCNTLGVQVNFANNNNQFSILFWNISLDVCQNVAAGNYQSLYFPVFLEGFNFNPLTSPMLTYTISESGGVQTLIITSAFNKQAIYKNVPLSNERFKMADFSFYPNPSENSIEINMNGTFSNYATLEIYNALGVLCKTENLISNKTQIELQDFSSGIYFLKIRTKEGTTLKKLIKK